MKRLLLIALCTSACGSATDDRPATLDYITETILAPTCANAECHSAFKQEVGDEFDTADATRRSLVLNNLVQYPGDTMAPAGAGIIVVLRSGLPSILDPGSGDVRMPYDEPMPDADVALIEKWIADGAEGAQCQPNDQGLGCLRTGHGAGTSPTYQVVKCTDGNIGDVVQDCTAGQVCDVAVGNGQCVGAGGGQ
jgi:hypothetical protein